MSILNFGQYSGQTAEGVARSNPHYIVWAYENIVSHGGIEDALYAACVRRIGRYPGIIPPEYREEIRNENKVAYNADGSGVRHCGGPCGDQYLDIGNT